jgi:tetratricopeptide (TPR) repeat protein
VKAALLAVLAVAVAGCATTAQSRGERALVYGNYPAALAEFQTALGEHPDRVRALRGLAVAQYKLGALAESEASFERVLAREPENGTALLYGGLVALQRRQDDVAADRLTRFRALEPDPRFGAQVDRAFALLQAQPVSDEVRAFVATSIEDAARATLEVRAAQVEAARAWAFSSSYGVRCYPTRRGGLVCL